MNTVYTLGLEKYTAKNPRPIFLTAKGNQVIAIQGKNLPGLSSHLDKALEKLSSLGWVILESKEG
jgi:hypothetical protein